MSRKKTIKSITDLKPDPENANKGTERGVGMLEHSLSKYGAGRSILATSDGTVIAGNKTLQQAADLDIPVRVVQTDGKELVVVQRTDLKAGTKEAKGLAVADNRVAQVDLDFDLEQLLADSEAGLVDLDEWWFEGELDFSDLDLGDSGDGGEGDNSTTKVKCPTCGAVVKAK